MTEPSTFFFAHLAKMESTLQSSWRAIFASINIKLTACSALIYSHTFIYIWIEKEFYRTFKVKELRGRNWRIKASHCSCRKGSDISRHYFSLLLLLLLLTVSSSQNKGSKWALENIIIGVAANKVRGAVYKASASRNRAALCCVTLACWSFKPVAGLLTTRQTLLSHIGSD